MVDVENNQIEQRVSAATGGEMVSRFALSVINQGWELKRSVYMFKKCY